MMSSLDKFLSDLSAELPSVCSEEKLTENVDSFPTHELVHKHEPIKLTEIKFLESRNNQPTTAIPSAPKINYYYLIQVKGDPTFRLTAKSARNGGAIAEFTAAGWVYKDKKDAEEVATRWTQGKRTLVAVKWYEPLLDKVWGDSKEEARLAKKEISLEIKKLENNKQINLLTVQCAQGGIHWSVLCGPIENLPEDCSEKDRKVYELLKPQWDKAKEEEKENDLRLSDLRMESEDLINIAQTNEVILEGIRKKITDLQSLHKRFAQLEAPGRPCVIINRIDAQPITEKDFKSRLSSEVVLVGCDTNGNPKYVSASKFWMGHAHKHILTKITFTNDPIDEYTYNLFSGFGVHPASGNCELILNHIKEVICAGCEISYKAFVKLLAWQIQNIGKPSRVITILKSTVQQVGKGCLASDILLKIYGNAGFSTSDLGQITARFNDTIRGKACIFLDEALFSGNRKSADAIKSIATSTQLGIETKGLPTVQVPIGVNFFLATNHEDAAYIEEADARYWIFEVSPHRAGDVDYFTSLYKEIENGGREAFMHYLQSLDVSGFIPSRDVPKNNAAKDAMINNSINPYDARKWLEQCCEAGMLLGYKLVNKKSSLPWEAWTEGDEHENGIFSAAYTEWQKSVRSSIEPKPTSSSKKFGELLNAAGLVVRVDGKRWRTLPSTEQCLKLLAEYGKSHKK